MAVGDQVMSSTERAPEPTMEEILASIRRIISDDESNSARQRTASASQRDEEGLEAAEGEADDRIINDIARVLSASAPAAEEEEDILDLTAELGGMEIVEETVSVAVLEEAAPAEVSSEPEAFQPAPATLEQPAELAPEPQAQAAPPLTASEEAASALERAIAALRAGHVPTSVPGSMPEFAVPEFAAQPEPEPEPQSELPAFTPEPEPELEPEPEWEPEPELVLTEFEAEMIVEEPVEIEATLVSEAAESPAWESEAAPWAGAPEPLVEPERPGGRVNGGTHAAASPLEASNKTLEDSVKDMLRPMLRQWLDENMPRMVTAALKDELGDNSARGQGD
jgi:cell pole-organizing protein PopZ